MKKLNSFLKLLYPNSKPMASLSALMVFLVFTGNSLVFAEKQSPTPSASYAQARKVYFRLVNAHDKRPSRDEWLFCIGKFNGVDTAFPASQEAYKAVYTVARIYQQIANEFGYTEDLGAAFQHYQKVVDSQGFKYLGDDALYHQGEIHLERKNLVSANEVFKTILEKYPEGDQTAKVKKVLAEIKPQLSKQSPVDVAETHRPPVQKAKLKKDVVVDVPQKAEETHKIEITPQFVPKPVTAISTPVVNHLPAVPLVVLDPGHGGKDMGAQGERGLLEKAVNLEVAKRVEEILVSRYKYRVMLTRGNDSFVSLKDRGTLANENGASVFVSIHTNAAPRKSAMGVETYFLGMGANDRARETAARENGELVKSVSDDQVQNILTDLLSTTKINASSRLAGRVQNHMAAALKKYDGVKSLGVKEGPFFVLHDTNMPSILVELGFITNSVEERRLDSPAYLNLLAFSIARGIHEFLREREPLI